MESALLTSDVVETSHLTDADWTEINKLRRAYETGGRKALSKAMAELGKDPVQYMRVMAAYLPDIVREAIKDQMAEIGVTEQDLRELIRKLESPTGKQ
jgi:hypothetical protein